MKNSGYDIITREQWNKLVLFNGYTPDDGDAYPSDGVLSFPHLNAFDGLPDDATHVMLVPK